MKYQVVEITSECETLFPPSGETGKIAEILKETTSIYIYELIFGIQPWYLKSNVLLFHN